MGVHFHVRTNGGAGNYEFIELNFLGLNHRGLCLASVIHIVSNIISHSGYLNTVTVVNLQRV